MSDWRQSGTVSAQLWQSVIEHAGGPSELASRAAWEAAGEHSALALAMLNVESKYGTAFNRNIPANRNALNLRPPSGDGYMSYPAWSTGVRAWRERITSPGYKGGIYAATQSLEDLIHVYAPSTDDNDEAAYVATIRTLWLTWGVKENTMADLVFGKVPYPQVTQRHLPIENEWVKPGAPIIPEAVVWHRMIGTLWGTDTWFFGDHAATAYGVGVIAQDGQDDAGRIIEWMSPSSGYYGESSGPAKGPYGDGAKLIQRVGLDYNRVTKAIEISGVTYDVPLDEPARAAIVNLTAYFADQKRIPWNEFPNVPGQDRSYVIWHQEICGPAEKACPGSIVMNETSALIARVAGVLKRYQTQGQVITPKPPAYADSKLPDWWDESVESPYPTDQSENGVKFYVCRRNFAANAGTRRLAKPSGDAERSGPNLKTAEKVHGERYVINGKERWILTNDGHFVSAGKMSPPVKIG